MATVHIYRIKWQCKLHWWESTWLIEHKRNTHMHSELPLPLYSFLGCSYTYLTLYSHDGPNHNLSSRIAYYVTIRHGPASIRAERFVKQQRPKSQFGSLGRNAEILPCSVNSPLSCECWLWRDPNHVACHVTDSSVIMFIVWIQLNRFLFCYFHSEDQQLFYNLVNLNVCWDQYFLK